jgi:hypothetical protein
LQRGQVNRVGDLGERSTTARGSARPSHRAASARPSRRAASARPRRRAATSGDERRRGRGRRALCEPYDELDEDGDHVYEQRRGRPDRSQASLGVGLARRARGVVEHTLFQSCCSGGKSCAAHGRLGISGIPPAAAPGVRRVAPRRAAPHTGAPRRAAPRQLESVAAATGVLCSDGKAGVHARTARRACSSASTSGVARRSIGAGPQRCGRFDSLARLARTMSGPAHTSLAAGAPVVVRCPLIPRLRASRGGSAPRPHQRMSVLELRMLWLVARELAACAE